MNRALIISDLHLGSPLFNKKYEFLKLIESPKYDIIFLNGDIIDIWEKKLKDIVKDNSTIIDTIKLISRKKPVYYIIGNHDPKIEELLSIFPDVKLVPMFQDENLCIIHGHEFDEFISKYSWIMKILFIPHWIGERFGLNIKAFFRELSQSIANKKNKSYYKDLVNDIDNATINKYKRKCNFLITGHTHDPKIIKTTNLTYINDGDLIHNYTYVEFNILDKTFELKRM